MNKKLLSLLLALLMLLSITACGGQSADTSKPTEAPVQTEPETEPEGEPETEPETEPEAEPETAPEEAAGPTAPEGYPAQNISWVVPVAAGTPTDLATRQLADGLKEILGVSISVENITGGNQTIATNDALSRPADGYTLLSFANAGLITQPLMNPDIGYGLDDFKLLAMITPACMATITVPNDSEIKTYDDFVQFVQTHEEFSYAVPNSGGYGHLSALSLLGQIEGANLGKAIAYDGNNGAYQALLTGEVDFAISDDNFIYTHFNDGECNTIVCLSNAPSYYLPDVPAVGDYGIEDMDALAGWKIAAVRADTPDDIVEYLTACIDQVIATDEYAEYLLNSGCGSFEYIQDPEEITGLVKDAFAIYEEILTEAGLM